VSGQKRTFLCTAVVVLACTALAAQAEAGEPGPMGRGLKLMHMQGCTACHSLTGESGAGPTLAGRFARPTLVRSEGREYALPFDADYLARSLATPEAEVAVGFPRGVMPSYALDAEQLAAITETLRTLEPAPPPAARWPIALAALIAAAGALGWWRYRRNARVTRAAA